MFRGGGPCPGGKLLVGREIGVSSGFWRGSGMSDLGLDLEDAENYNCKVLILKGLKLEGSERVPPCEGD